MKSQPFKKQHMEGNREAIIELIARLENEVEGVSFSDCVPAMLQVIYNKMTVEIPLPPDAPEGVRVSGNIRIMLEDLMGCTLDFVQLMEYEGKILPVDVVADKVQEEARHAVKQ